MSDLKEIATRVFLDTLNAIELDSLIRREVTLDGNTLCVGPDRIDLGSYGEVVMIGIGKACVKMGAAMEQLLGDRIKRSLLVTDRRPSTRLRSEVVVGGHPLPDRNSLIAGERVVDLVQSCSSNSLLIFLISGGGSALVELPIVAEITLEDLRRTNHILTRCGAGIREINVVRKHLSRIKGGRLGYLARNVQVISLFVSDVNTGDLQSLASNPLFAEEPAAGELADVLDRFGLMETLPDSVCAALARTLQVKPMPAWHWERRQPVFRLLLENSDVVEKAAALTRDLGFRVEVSVESSDDDYRHVANRAVECLLRLVATFRGEPVCVISGGEVLCPVRGDGVGGRNQEFVLYSASLLAGRGLREVAVLSCGTDGIDGNSNAAGAVADGRTAAVALLHDKQASGFMATNNSHSFFKNVGGLIVTGPTGNNVRDLRILMAQS